MTGIPGPGSAIGPSQLEGEHNHRCVYNKVKLLVLTMGYIFTARMGCVGRRG
jgi:hypothetical protein